MHSNLYNSLKNKKQNIKYSTQSNNVSISSHHPFTTNFKLSTEKSLHHTQKQEKLNKFDTCAVTTSSEKDLVQLQNANLSKVCNQVQDCFSYVPQEEHIQLFPFINYPYDDLNIANEAFSQEFFKQKNDAQYQETFCNDNLFEGSKYPYPQEQENLRASVVPLQFQGSSMQKIEQNCQQYCDQSPWQKCSCFESKIGNSHVNQSIDDQYSPFINCSINKNEKAWQIPSQQDWSMQFWHPFIYEEENNNNFQKPKISYYHLYEQYIEQLRQNKSFDVVTEQFKQRQNFPSEIISKSCTNSKIEFPKSLEVNQSSSSYPVGSSTDNLMSSCQISQTQLNNDQTLIIDSSVEKQIKIESTISEIKSFSRFKKSKKKSQEGNKKLARCGQEIAIEVEGVVEDKKDRKRSKKTLFYRGRDGIQKKFARITKSMIRPVCNALSKHLKSHGANIDRIDWLNQLRDFLVNQKEFIPVAVDFFQHFFQKYVENSPKLIEKQEYLMFKDNWIKGVKDPINFKGLKQYN